MSGQLRLIMGPKGWKREFLRPDGAAQVGQGWINGDPYDDVEIWLRLPETHHIMTLGWQERARVAAERKLNADPIRNASVVSLELWEVEQTDAR